MTLRICDLKPRSIASEDDKNDRYNKKDKAAVADVAEAAAGKRRTPPQ